jgi:hypothetical protein
MEKEKYNKIVNIKFINDAPLDFSFEVEENQYNSFPQVLPNSFLTINPGDKVYFVPGINIPRVKIKNIVMDYGASITRDVTQATKIIGYDTKSEYFQYQGGYQLNTSTTIEFLKAISDIGKQENRQLNIEDHCIQKVNSLLDYLEVNNIDDTEIAFFTDWSCTRTFKQFSGTDDFSVLANKLGTTYKYEYYYKFKAKIPEEFAKFKHTDLYSELAMLEQINGDDALIIDQEKYDQLASMFQSSDRDNHVLAMEIMSNCDYSESFFFLLLIFANYGDVFRYNKAKNHVNFKALLNYMELHPSNMSVPIHHIIKRMFKKGLLKQEHLDYMVKHYLRYLFSMYDDMFEVHTLTVKPEVLEYLNANYKNTLVAEEYQEVKEEQPVEPLEPVFEVKEDNFNWI